MTSLAGPLTRSRRAALQVKKKHQPLESDHRTALTDLSNRNGVTTDKKNNVQKMIARSRRRQPAEAGARCDQDTTEDDRRGKPRSVQNNRVLAPPHPIISISMPDPGHSPRQFQFTDIDIDDRDCGFAAYCNEIYEHMRANELKHCPCIDYIACKNRVINHKMRTILVDWLVEVADEYSLSPQTLFMSVSLIDSFMRKSNVERKFLQLVGITCMFIASKYEEIHPPSASEFSYISDYTYTTNEVIAMEDIVLRKLGFDISMVTSWEFRRRFGYALAGDPTVLSLSTYLLELSLQGTVSLVHRPSILAAASISLSLQTLKKPHWTSLLTHNTGYKYEEVRSCVHDLYDMFAKTTVCNTVKVTAVAEKYARHEHHQVSTLPPPKFVV